MSAAATKRGAWPGSQPPTPREIEAANRRLVTAMKRHREQKKKLDQVERELRAARARVRELLRLIVEGGSESPPRAPTCEACQGPLGKNPRCLDCQAYGQSMTPTEPEGAA